MWVCVAPTPHPRELADFLKSGDKALGFPRHKGWRHGIGSGFPEAPLREGGGGSDPQSASAEAARDWVRMVGVRSS